MISGVFRATGTIGATQRSSENDEAAESLRAPLLVVVHAPFLGAIAQISDAGCACRVRNCAAPVVQRGQTVPRERPADPNCDGNAVDLTDARRLAHADALSAFH